MCRRFWRGRCRHVSALLFAAILLGAAGCQRTTVRVPPGAHEIEMVVLKGVRGETLALVPVYIDGQGPFAFALDTGASRTVVDSRLAAELGLPPAGDPAEVTGVGGKIAAQPVRVTNWRVGEIEIPAATLDAVELSGGDRAGGMRGLLGSDTLSRFQVIQVDYQNQRLVFHPGPSGRLAMQP